VKQLVPKLFSSQNYAEKLPVKKNGSMENGNALINDERMELCL
jgi:hypothetical protein